ncbi:MAG: hypothetical protein WD767_10270 [Alphaproteobacteria bacterium]
MIGKVFTAAVAAIAFAGAAQAQDNMRDDTRVGPAMGDWEVTLSGNGTSDNDFDNHSLGLTGSAGKYVSDNVMLGLRQSVNFADIANGDSQANFATRGFADYVFDLGRWRPYAGLSIGAIYGDNVNDTLAAGPEVGVKYYADNRTFVYAQAEYQFTFDDAGDVDDAADDGQFFYGIGVGFNF